MKYDVIIVGGGMVGAALAVALKNTQIMQVFVYLKNWLSGLLLQLTQRRLHKFIYRIVATLVSRAYQHAKKI